MRTIFSVFSVILVLATVTATATAKPPAVVYPTGTFPTDVQNVQAAIDQGGTVLLKATDSVGHLLAFNFGTPQHLPPLRAVIIQNDVSIMGETVGTSRTTVSGGSTPFRVFGGKNSIQGIKFDGPLARAILVRVSSGTSVIGNEVQNVVPDPLAAGFTQADGIDLFATSPADISGNLVISENTFDDLTGDFSIAIQIDTVAANVTISNNTFQLGQLASDLGFSNSAAILCFHCHSIVSISSNLITIGPGVVYAGIGLNGGPDARYHVFGNTISSQGPLTDGVDVASGMADDGGTVAAVIERNTMTGNFGGGIALFGAVSNSTIQGNTVTGSAIVALAGIQLFPDDLIDQVTSNRFLNNDIASVTASLSSIFFGTNTVKNIVRGQCVSVIDLGINNDISCPSSHSNVNSSAFTTRQQMLQRTLQAQSVVHSQANGVNRP